MAIETKEQQGIVRAPDFYGKGIRVIGPQQSPDPHDDPHAKNRRGELGPTLQNNYFNRFSIDPLSRVGTNAGLGDPKVVLSGVLGRAKKGQQNEEKLANIDPVAMTRHIKAVAKALGIDQVGIAMSLPEFIYKGGARRTEDETLVTAATGQTPEDIAKKYPYAICFLVAWDDDLVRAHRHHIADQNYHFYGMKAEVAQNNLAGYIQELGYTANMGAANPMPMALAAGLGQLGRNGMVISEFHGARHNPKVILTDLPLVFDKPVDLGVDDFCNICRKCAVACPTNSISHEEKKVINGVEKFAINWQTCYRIRPHMRDFWGSCFTCIAACPWTKKNTWWRTATVQTLKRTPSMLRPLLIRPLIALDNAIWGELPRKRVKWMGYDSARDPHDHGCNISDCSCREGEQLINVGQYMPLKENARRFHKN
jgi:epoxyqueuosine reductase QueG